MGVGWASDGRRMSVGCECQQSCRGRQRKCMPRTVAIDVKHAHETRKTDIIGTHEPLLRLRFCGTPTHRLSRPPRENKNAGKEKRRGREEKRRDEKRREDKKREEREKGEDNSEVVREILPGLIRPGSNTSYNFHFADRGNTARPVRLMQKSQQGAPKILEHCG